MMPRVSVILPTHNRPVLLAPQYLVRALGILDRNPNLNMVFIGMP